MPRPQLGALPSYYVCTPHEINMCRERERERGILTESCTGFSGSSCWNKVNPIYSLLSTARDSARWKQSRSGQRSVKLGKLPLSLVCYNSAWNVTTQLSLLLHSLVWYATILILVCYHSAFFATTYSAWYATTQLSLLLLSLVCYHSAFFATTQLGMLPLSSICYHTAWYATPQLDMLPHSLVR